MSIERKANRVLEEATAIAGRVKSWADFSAAVFDQASGVVAKAFPTEIERQAFYDSEQYKAVQGLLTGLMRRFGVAAGAQTKEKSGRFVVRVPKTIHHKLDIEAKREGVSLNQLAVTKLSLPLPKSTGIAESVIIQAFNKTHGGYSPDWVIIEPHHNQLFLEACREAGLGVVEYADAFLNHLLMNIRKTTKFKGQLLPTTKPCGYKSYEDCAFAAEIAIRTLQRTEGATLDRTLCDPELRQRFDQIALSLVPDQTVIKLRSAALNLRKTHKLQKVDLRPDVYDLVSVGPVKAVSLSDIASLPGAYVFYDYTRPLFAGESDNLQRRLGMHLKGGLPRWLSPYDEEGITLKYTTLPAVKRPERLSWLAGFINRERPLLNYQKVG